MLKRKCVLDVERSSLALFLTGILSLSLAGFVFFFFIVNRGGTGASLNVCAASLILLMVTGKYNPLKYRLVFCTVFIMTFLALMSLLVPWGNPDHKTIFLFIRLIFIVLAIHYLSSLRDSSRMVLFQKYIALGLLSGIIIWQFYLCVVRHHPYGAYSNPHYLSSVSILTLPLVFFFFSLLDRAGKVFLMVIGTLNVVTLIFTSSRPAWISIILSSLFGILAFSKGIKRRVGLSALAGSVALLLVFNGKVKVGIMSLVQNIGQEERILIWKDTLSILKRNSLVEWFLGHGIGSIREIRYPNYPQLNFPHNFFLEMLYDNGLTGMILITVPLVFLLVLLIRNFNLLENKGEKVFLLYLTILFFAWFFHAGIVFPFYSKYSMFPFSFILGCMITYGEKIRYVKVVMKSRGENGQA
jgi:O-antigen ligase